ncbi:hypothetical protein MAPG_07773, partial [Magnaporthiopsis poae ATCC 64411]
MPVARPVFRWPSLSMVHTRQLTKRPESPGDDHCVPPSLRAAAAATIAASHHQDGGVDRCDSGLSWGPGPSVPDSLHHGRSLPGQEMDASGRQLLPVVRHDKYKRPERYSERGKSAKELSRTGAGRSGQASFGSSDRAFRDSRTFSQRKMLERAGMECVSLSLHLQPGFPFGRAASPSAEGELHALLKQKPKPLVYQLPLLVAYHHHRPP